MNVVEEAVTARSQRVARARLTALFPTVGPWTSAALWHGRRPPPSPPQSPLEDELAVVHDQRLTGLLLRYVRDSGAVLRPSEQAELQRAAFSWTHHTHRAAAASAPAIADLARACPELAVFKGPGIARFYPSADCRPYSDLDILAPARSFRRMVTQLEEGGWLEEERNRQPWDYVRWFCREGINLREESVTGGAGSLDVHHRVPPWIWSDAMIDDGMAARAESIEVAGTTLRCLSAADNLLVVALHVISDRNAPGQSLIVWRDLVELANAAKIDEAVAAASAAGLAGWVKALLSALPEPFGTDELAAALPDQPLPHPQRLSFLLSDRASRLGVIASQVLRLPLPNGLAFAAGMAVPSPGFLAMKYPTDSHRYRRWWSNSKQRLR